MLSRGSSGRTGRGNRFSASGAAFSTSVIVIPSGAKPTLYPLSSFKHDKVSHARHQHAEKLFFVPSHLDTITVSYITHLSSGRRQQAFLRRLQCCLSQQEALLPHLMPPASRFQHPFELTSGRPARDVPLCNVYD